MNIPCPECGSTKQTWEPIVRNRGGAVDGRLKLNEIDGAFVLGCDECSTTVEIVPSNKIADHLNSAKFTGIQ
jgi:uncharacterized Zn finger protein